MKRPPILIVFISLINAILAIWLAVAIYQESQSPCLEFLCLEGLYPFIYGFALILIVASIGLWKGWRVGQVLFIIFGLVSIFLGQHISELILLFYGGSILYLLINPTAREYFRKTRP